MRLMRKGKLDALEAAGCSMIRTETRTGTTLEGRAKLKTILDFLRPGDTLVVTRIDRLAIASATLQEIVWALRYPRGNRASDRHRVGGG